MLWVTKLPIFWSFYYFRYPVVLPINYTISLLYRCNSRCKTCFIWEKDVKELTAEEYEKIFKSLGSSPVWVTFSGGEPFLRDDLTEIVTSFANICKPKLINIPTNGLLTERIVNFTKKILSTLKRSSLIINLSLDHLDDRHDEIRGVKGNFTKAINTFKELKKIKNPNLSVGIHTVISRFNVKDIKEIFTELTSLSPDSYILEVAEERVELNTVGKEITPLLEDYIEALNFIKEKLNQFSPRGIYPKLAKAFRLEYYDLTQKYFLGTPPPIPCYAAFASCQITPEGEVWSCCIKGESMGNLKDFNLHFPSLWKSKLAKEVRKKIKRGCFCPLANASYTNLLLHPPSWFKILPHLVKK